ncbi:hypothetical protein RCL1_001708 [Eukaryota sp. TZLM3-RCL]
MFSLVNLDLNYLKSLEDKVKSELPEYGLSVLTSVPLKTPKAITACGTPREKLLDAFVSLSIPPLIPISPEQPFLPSKLSFESPVAMESVSDDTEMDMDVDMDMDMD